MIQPNNPILARMLDRLFASMLNGPSMNCRPHASRQRLDLGQLAKLKDVTPGDLLRAMIGEKASVRLAARVPLPSRKAIIAGDELKAREQREAEEAWSAQQAVRSKLHIIADDARTYEQDTGVHALHLGFPLLSLPPGMFGGRTGSAPSRRVLAPIAFIPLTMSVKTAGQHAVEIARREGVDRIVPNLALLAWLENETGRPLTELLAPDPKDEKAAAASTAPANHADDAWTDILTLVRAVAEVVEVPVSELFALDQFPAEAFLLQATPKADDEARAAVLHSAVLGLFPASNQGLLRDTQEMVADGAADGPIGSFVKLGVNLDARAMVDPTVANCSTVAAALTDPAPSGRRDFSKERLIADADPCQARAVRLAGEYQGLVIHGPPGTGKSQTITNIISDHLGRGQRVLFVCDKRTALDVVADRLQSLGLGDLCAIVHDPQRDQRDLYRSVREQLDGLVDVEPRDRAAAELDKVDADLQTLHADLTYYHNLLLGPSNGGTGSFHHLVGLWLSETGCPDVHLEDCMLGESSAADLRAQGTRLKEVLERGHGCGYATNPWKSAAGVTLAEFLATPMRNYRAAIDACIRDAAEADATRDEFAPPYAANANLAGEADARVRLAGRLEDVIGRTNPADRARWAARAANHVVAAGQRLAESAPWIDVLKNGPIDNGIAAPGVATADQLARSRDALAKYLKGFSTVAMEFARVKRDAGADADDTVILRWLAAGTRAAGAALAKLRSAQPLATAVAQTSIDPALVAAADRLAIDPAKMAAWNSALDTYLEVADKMLGGFYFARKAAAEPVVRQFGRQASSATAREIKDLLINLQARADLRSLIEDVTGDTLPDRMEDDDLLAHFFRHDTVLSAICAAEKGGAAGAGMAAAQPLVPDEHVGAINNIIALSSAPATKVLAGYGLECTPRDAKRLETALKRFEARVRLADLHRQTLAAPGAMTPDADEDLVAAAESFASLFELLIDVRDPAKTRSAVCDVVLRALREIDHAPTIVKALADAPKRVAAIRKLDESLAAARLFDAQWRAAQSKNVRDNGVASEAVHTLDAAIDTFEGVLRVRDGLAALPPPLGVAAARLLDAGAEPNDGYSAVRRAVLSGEITRRLRAEPNLQTVDGHRLKSTFDRYLELSGRKKHLVRETIAGAWVERQKERLLNDERTRLNAVAADLRRRLTGRGEKAMRLRQVIGHGAGVEGGDPLFELRPVWMASPETVAQLFPRDAIFDLIVFDEASQCRLEEALPVLTRAKRVVIAGDPKQLPPTRFFESGITASDEDDAEGEQELFEQHQGEIEDVLAAALGLDIHQCYLDVHYRSRNGDLIGFSNEQFYGSRLQAIPEHPRGRTRSAPITLVHAGGAYDKRRNEAEADAVVAIVKDLLGRPLPPSVGIACFNLPQRDLIVEKLEEAAEDDKGFAEALAEARSRRGANSSESLFVKNLENVQGDERDHLIVSTTYGPDRNGRFRRNFGPVGKPGGGRRLNVLVTRAREHVHVVTSIPRGEYANLPAVPQGSTPGGAWLLFAYLNHCERLADDYETAWRILESTRADEARQVNLRPSRTPSQFARALAGRLVTAHDAGSDVHWGNAGFCVDLAMHHPQRAEDVTIGVMCDTTRFPSDDAVEWEVFRTHVLQSQGWQLHRVWTPHFFRDPAGCMDAILKDVDEALDREKERTAKASVEDLALASAPTTPLSREGKQRAGRKHRRTGAN